MRTFLALGLLITLCASADAATVVRAKRPEGRLRAGQYFAAPKDVTAPKGYAVPGWTDAETRKWLGNASAASGLY
jgi:hypothetical protein